MDKARRQKRLEAYQRAEYHTFAALRGWIPGGNDPLTGRSWSDTFSGVYILDEQRQRFAREYHKAHARFWIGEASRFAEA